MSRKNKINKTKFFIKTFLFTIVFNAVIMNQIPLIDDVWALEPPDPMGIQALQPGETMSARREAMRERIDFARKLGNQKIDSFRLKKALTDQQRRFLRSQGITSEELSLAAPLPAPPAKWQGMPSTGSVKILTLLIEFLDHTHTNSRDFIHENLFGAGQSSRKPYESLSTYYKQASYDQLDFSSGTTLGWYKTLGNRSAISKTDNGRESLIKEALNHFNLQGHDFTQYDNNNDGVIDYLVIIWTGPDEGWASFWWGYQTQFQDSSFKLDGVGLNRYSWQWESRPVGGTFNPLVVIHETGHALGLPDFYDYDDTIGPQGGVGGLDMMDANKGDHNCFSKWMLGWLTPTVVANGSKALTLKP